MLSSISEVFSALDSEGVRYVHWKSNEHLGEALRGETDLDILVEQGSAQAFDEIVEKLGFLPMEPPKARQIPGIDSYLGYDTGSGRLVHLDVHYRVVLGEQLLKNHHLPVEDWLLAETSEHLDVAVPAPERELLILFIRSGLKTKSRQIVRASLKGGSPLPENIRREARWLAEQADPDRLGATAASSGLPVGRAELLEFRERALDDRMEWRYVLATKRSLLSRLRSYERMPWYAAFVRRVWVRTRNGRLMNRLGLGLPRRHLGFTTPVIAVVGADGSGKTRLTRDLESWLAGKLVVRHFYFGQPKSGVVFKMLNKPGSVARNRGQDGSEFPSLLRYTEAAKWLWLALVRRRLARTAWGAARQGNVVICERYPLADFFSMKTPMDGPRLQSTGPWATTEMRIYGSMPEPDLLLILDGDLETLRARKEDLTREEHIPKVEAVAALEEVANRIRIDVTQPYKKVLAMAKSAVWEGLSEGR